MPVLDTERRSTTRSALRYRPINTDESGSAPVIARQRRSRPDTLAISAPAAPDDLNPVEEKDLPRRRRVVTKTPQQRSITPARARRRFHPLFFVGIGLFVTILLWVGITQLVAWGANAYNTILYGYPRTFQTDAIVGHQDSASSPSHFLALNFHGQIEVIEFPGGDPTHARVFLGPQLFGPNSDLAPATLRFTDLNGDGKPDMVIEVQSGQIVFLNDQGSFRPLKQNEQNQIMQHVRQLGE
jgi:hypothetical protein